MLADCIQGQTKRALRTYAILVAQERADLILQHGLPMIYTDADDSPDIFHCHLFPSFQCHESLRSPVGDNVPSDPINVHKTADLTYL